MRAPGLPWHYTSALALVLAFRKRSGKIIRFTVLGFFSALFLLELSGVVDLAALLAGWFLFQG